MLLVSSFFKLPRTSPFLYGFNIQLPTVSDSELFTRVDHLQSGYFIWHSHQLNPATLFLPIMSSGTRRLTSNRRKSSDNGKKSVPASRRLKKPIIDRFSELPEALIVHIISFLPMKDKIRTGAVARKWRYLWTRSPILYLKGDTDDSGNDGFFELDDSYPDSSDAFVEYANKILSLCGGTPLKEFGIEYMYDDCHESHVNRWTHFAARNGAEKFELHFDEIQGPNCYTLPQHLYHHSCFRELKFSYCEVVPSGPVSWKNLKKLSITNTYVSGDALHKIVAGSPVLDVLDMQELYNGTCHYHFGNSDVKELILEIGTFCPDDDMEPELEISAPNLEFLKVEGSFQSFKLLNMLSLVEANLCDLSKTVAVQHPIITPEVVRSLSNAHTLTFGDCVMQGIEMLREKGVHPSLSKCKHLTVVISLSSTGPNAIASLLKSSPGVETLIVTEFSDNRREAGFSPRPDNSSSIDQYWISQEAASGYLTQLRTVNFVGFWDYRRDAFSFVRFLLKNAKNLQKMIINLESEDECMSFDPEEAFEIAQKLLSYPRSSPDAELLVYK